MKYIKKQPSNLLNIRESLDSCIQKQNGMNNLINDLKIKANFGKTKNSLLKKVNLRNNFG